MSTPNAFPSLHTPEAAMRAIVEFFEQLQREDVSRLGHFYRADATFKDPFNDVQGVPAITHIFAHMFDALVAPRFVITQSVQQGAHAFVTWDFVFAPRAAPSRHMTIRGATHFVLREEGGHWRIATHRDYWDAADELYAQLPVLGALMRWLKKKLAS